MLCKFFKLSRVAQISSLWLFIAGTYVYAFQAAPVDPSNTYNCTTVTLDEMDPSLLTKEERIALLDGNLQASIDNYSVCVNTAANISGGGSGSKGQGEGDSNANENSATASDGAPTENEEQQVVVEKLPTSPVTIPTRRGVIPPKDNDKTICKLLFQEISTTVDSAMLKGLKDQYADYKCG